MFSNCRSKKIVLVSHCILNQNSISDGTAYCPATNESVFIERLRDKLKVILI